MSIEHRTKQLKQILTFLAPMPLALISLFRFKWLKARRGILIYDLRFYNCSIGDVLLESMILKQKMQDRKLAELDVAFVVPREHPLYRIGEDRGEFKVHEANYPTYLNEITLLAEFCGARHVHIFREAHEALEFYWEHFFEYGRVHPSLNLWWFNDCIRKFYKTPPWNYDVVVEHFRKTKTLPEFVVSPLYKKWLSWFRKKHVGGRKFVTLTFRFGSPNDGIRNMTRENVLRMLEEINRIQGIYCLILGVPDSLGDLSIQAAEGNTFEFSKNKGLTVFQEFLLVQEADFCVGSNTGPSIVAMLANKPYLVFDFNSPEIAPFSEFFYGQKLQSPFGFDHQTVIHDSESVPIEVKVKILQDYLKELRLPISH